MFAYAVCLCFLLILFAYFVLLIFFCLSFLLPVFAFLVLPGALQWLQKNRTEGCSGAALAMAAGSGHLSTVEWFYGNGIQGDIAKAIEAADEGGHIEVGRREEWGGGGLPFG